jgi:hypothetical protein
MENPTTTGDLTGNDPQATQPNIILVMVDQMRIPYAFSTGHLKCRPVHREIHAQSLQIYLE